MEPPSPLGLNRAEFPPGFQPEVWDATARRYIQTPLEEASRFITIQANFGLNLTVPPPGAAYHRSAQFKAYQQWLLHIREKDKAELAMESECFVPGYQLPRLEDIAIEGPLKAWSEETVMSLRVMLHAQHEIQNDKVLRLARIDNGRAVQDTEKLGQMCQPEDDFEMPTLELDLRVDIKVIVRLKTRPGVPPYEVQLQGNESVRLLKQMIRDYYVSEGQFGRFLEADEFPEELHEERALLKEERRLLEERAAQEEEEKLRMEAALARGEHSVPLLAEEVDETAKEDEDGVTIELNPSSGSQFGTGTSTGQAENSQESPTDLEESPADAEESPTDMEEAPSEEEEPPAPPTCQELLTELAERERLLDERYADVEAQVGDLLRLRSMNLFHGEYNCEDDASVWGIAVLNIEEFDPAKHQLELDCTLDMGECLVVCSQFDNFILVGIILNTLTMSLEYYENPWTEKNEGFSMTVNMAEYVFSLFFAAEMILKIVCLKGCGVYFRDNSNKFDCFIVCSSLMAFLFIIFEELEGMPGINILRVFRLFRAMRVARVLRKVKSVRLLVDAAFGSLKPIANILVCMMLVIIVFACIGMQLYGSKMDELDDRRNFDDFPHAFFTLFIVITASGWEEIMFNCMLAEEARMIGAPFILLFFIIQNYIVLNLFVGAILANMSSVKDKDRKAHTQELRSEGIQAQRLARQAHLWVKEKATRWEEEGCHGPVCSLTELTHQAFFVPVAQKCWTPVFVFTPCCGTVEMDRFSLGVLAPTNRIRSVAVRITEHPFWEGFIMVVIFISTMALVVDTPDQRESYPWLDGALDTADPVFMIIFSVEFGLKMLAYGCYFTDNIELMMNDPTKLKALTLGDVGPPCLVFDKWVYLDLVVLFASYITFFGTALLEKAGAGEPLKILRLLRAIRPLRMVNRMPGMRLVVVALAKAGPGLGNVMVLIFFTFLIFSILATHIFKGYFFACSDGEGWIAGYEECRGYWENDYGVQTPRVWRNPHLLEGHIGLEPSFDNVGRSFILLFEIATLDAWEETLYQVMDIPSEHALSPETDAAIYNGLFLVVFVFVGALFMMQLFISVIIDAYCETDGSGWITEQQQIFMNLCQLVRMLQPEPKPIPQSNNVQRFFYDLFVGTYPQPHPILEQYILDGERPSSCWNAELEEAQQKYDQLTVERMSKVSDTGLSQLDEQLLVYENKLTRCRRDKALVRSLAEDALLNSPRPPGVVYFIGAYFDSVITACILFSIGMMIATWTSQPDWYTDLLDAFQIPLLAVFVCEMTIKHIGLGPIQYWRDRFNAFDGFVVGMAVVFLILGVDGQIAMLFRIGRTFRLLKRFPQLRGMMVTLIDSIPAIGNVFCVLFLIFFIYAVIGVNLFGKTKYGESYNENTNMRNWQNAMSMLYRCMTGNWRTMMYEQAISLPACTVLRDSKGAIAVDDCGSPIAAVVYHVTFQIATMFAVLNLVVAIIINMFSWVYFVEPSEITGTMDISAAQITHVKLIWDRLDLLGTGCLPIEHLALFLSLVRACVPEVLQTGNTDQLDQKQYRNLSDFGKGVNGTDQTMAEQKARRNYQDLLDRLGAMERSSHIQQRLKANGVDLSTGDDDHGIVEDFVDSEVIFCEKGSGSKVELKQVQFKTLMHVLLLDALQLDEDDAYACYCGRDPFMVSVPGYGMRPLWPVEDEVIQQEEEDKRRRIQNNLRKVFGRSAAEVEVAEDEKMKLNKKRNLKRKIANQITRAAMR